MLIVDVDYASLLCGCGGLMIKVSIVKPGIGGTLL